MTVFSQDIVATALPRAAAEGSTLALSAHIAPRLSTDDGTDAVLGQFADLTVWPSVDLEWQVVFGNGEQATATVVSAPPRADLWSALFNPATEVRGFAREDYADRKIRSYPARNIVAFLADRWAQVAAASLVGNDFPSVEDLLGDGGLGPLVSSEAEDPEILHGAIATLEDELDQFRVVDATPPGGSPHAIARDFMQLRAFHQRRMKAGEPVEVPLPEPDFHQVLAFLGPHPPLLRLLGLIVDLEVVGAELSLPDQTTVQVIPGWSPAHNGPTNLLTPRTACSVGPGRFEAVPAGADISNGHLRLADADLYQVSTIDHDGGGLKTLDLANNARRAQTRATQDSPTRLALPSLRSAGVSVVRAGRARQLRDRLDRVPLLDQELVAGNAPELFAEDVARGYRIDVHDDRSGAWHPLCARVSTYDFVEGESDPVVVEGEGYASTAPSHSSDPGEPNDLYHQESLFHWQGWSLVAPRPMGAINYAPDPESGNPSVSRPTSDPLPQYPLRIDTRAAPGSLPRLRFGHSYSLRARVVDLAGNSVPFDPTDSLPEATAGPVEYLRFEPIQTPPALLRSPRTEGEELERVVLRSNFDTAPDPQAVDRHFVPPRVSQLLAECHGMLDREVGGQIVLDKGMYQELVQRDVETLESSPQAAPAPHDPEGSFVYDTDEVDVTWLPDPLALGVAFRGLPGAADEQEVELCDFSADAWPNLRPVRLSLAEGSAPPDWRPAERLLYLELAKAEVVRVRFSAYMDPDQLPLMGLAAWVRERFPTMGLDPLAAAVAQGQHWMFTPHRTLTLVHAVRQPLAAPDFVVFGASKEPGATFAEISGTVTIDRKSTGQVDIVGSWEMPVDGGPGTNPDPVTPQPFSALAFSLNVDRQGPGEGAEPPVSMHVGGSHEFGDTRYRRVTYQADALSRFAEYFVERQQVVVPTGGTPVVLAGTGYFANSLIVRPVGEGGNAPYDNRWFTVDEEAGTLVFGNGPSGEIPLPGDTVDVSYLPKPIGRVTAEPVVESVRSSARPRAPEVLYALPVFGWEEDDVLEGGQVVGRSSRRRGGGVRVYMRRPWWTSGSDEKLAVLTWPAAEFENQASQAELDDLPIRPFVTQWGTDPVYLSRSTKDLHPRVADFLSANAEQNEFGVGLSELPGTDVNVAAHDVGFDAERDLWYCDIEVDSGLAYSPMIRLALARYQPNALTFPEDLRLSPVVLADFLPLAPDRVASVVRDPSGRDPNRLTVHVSGKFGSTQSGPPATAEVLVEQQLEGVEGELGWRQVGQRQLLDQTIDAAGINAHWSGEISVPETTAPLRLVIEQFDHFRSDGSPDPGDERITPRLVYLDILDVP